MGDLRCFKYTYKVSPTSAFGTFITQLYPNHNLSFCETSHPFLFLICFLQLVGTLEHDLFIYPLITYFGLCFSDWDLSPLSLFLLFPLCWVFCFMKFVRFHHHCELLQNFSVDLCYMWRNLSVFGGHITYIYEYPSVNTLVTFANSTLIILFSNLLKFFKENSSKSKNIVKKY